jgi:putative DNA primase/helicase
MITGISGQRLANKLVNYASEINGNLEASIFKQLVSGEPVEARLPYGQPFHFEEYAKLIFNCNELPKDVEHTNAYFRRFLIIPFDVTIPPQEQDKNLHTKIIEKELSGVFNWVLQGLNRLLEQKKVFRL